MDDPVTYITAELFNKNVLTSFDDDAESLLTQFFMYLPAYNVFIAIQNSSLLFSFGVTNKTCFELSRRSNITS